MRKCQKLHGNEGMLTARSCLGCEPIPLDPPQIITRMYSSGCVLPASVAVIGGWGCIPLSVHNPGPQMSLFTHPSHFPRACRDTPTCPDECWETHTPARQTNKTLPWPKHRLQVVIKRVERDYVSNPFVGT